MIIKIVMHLKVFNTPNDIFKYILSIVDFKNKVLLIPTGNTPMGLYNEMIKYSSLMTSTARTGSRCLTMQHTSARN